MRITPLLAVLFLAVVFTAVLCVPCARAQTTGPGSSSGSMLAPAAAEGGPSLSPPRWNLGADLLTLGRWLSATRQAEVRVAVRPALKTRPAVLKRNPFWVP